jgi:transposase-like protein
MQATISWVFPRAKHRFCLWHILNKLPHKFGSHSEYDNVKSALPSCVYNSLTSDEFDKRWQEILDCYNLQKNSWLCQLYREQHHWVPTYIKDTFWDGMSTTYRSESMDAFF